ncbi:hypothetical protein ACPF04_03515 [Campylobacter sp. MOP51]|uniref:hypothetical protein n=1 Tax=Campylobacter canis TaxID=3378588 RepID=UPI003C68F148
MEANKCLVPQQDEAIETEVVDDNKKDNATLDDILNSLEIKKLKDKIKQKWILEDMILQEHYR